MTATHQHLHLTLDHCLQEGLVARYLLQNSIVLSKHHSQNLQQHLQLQYSKSSKITNALQGCGNTMPDLVPFHSGQVENYNLLVLGQVQKLYKIYYYELTFCIENSVDPDQLASSEAS